MALYTSLGKIAYKYVNYATGTVLKSAKLVPVMVGLYKLSLVHSELTCAWLYWFYSLGT